VLPLPVAAFAQGKREAVRIQDYPGTANMPFRVAKAKGFCEAHGLICELQVIASGPLGAQALLARSIDVGFFPPEVQINAMIKGAELRAIANGVQRNILVVVIRNDIEAPNADKGFLAFMADLKGKKIGVPARASGVELNFILLAQSAGLKAENFTFVATGAPNTAYGALVTKQVDANATFEPSGVMCEVLQTCKLVYRASEATQPVEIVGTNGAGANFVVTKAMLDQKPDVVEALIAAAKDADAFIQDPENFDEVLKIAESFFKFDMARGDEIMAAQLKRAIPGYKAAISRSAFRTIADNMLSTQQISIPFDTSKAIYDKAP